MKYKTKLSDTQIRHKTALAMLIIMSFTLLQQLFFLFLEFSVNHSCQLVTILWTSTGITQSQLPRGMIETAALVPLSKPVHMSSTSRAAVAFCSSSRCSSCAAPAGPAGPLLTNLANFHQTSLTFPVRHCACLTSTAIRKLSVGRAY